MKRRAFLVAASILPLFVAPKTFAKKKAAPPKKAKKPAAGKSGPKPSTPPQTTANNSVLKAAHPGSSATRLPPVKAPTLPAQWQTFAVTTTVRLSPSQDRQRVWLPLPLNQDTLYQRNLGCAWQGNFEQGRLRRLPDGELEAFYCEWSPNVAPQLEITATLATADRQFDVSRRSLPPERDDILNRALQSTRQIPNADGAYALALKIVGRIVDPVAQARALFDWIVEHAGYDASLPACGNGDVRQQLETQRFGGRSADINGLFVALCRAIGIPARRVFGQRIAPSLTTDCLGIQADATHAAHCRAEFYIPGYSWIPANPSDVCRAIALESLSAENSKRMALRRILFGVWEMNWMAYNTSEEVSLPDGPALPFFTFPYLERAEGNLDGRNPEGFEYRMESRRIASG
ncbi:MAG: transglutaminase-like domain-containing protein [Zoogloeaceae bacterium]|nr:transglutaminase-like domain-containing protein [Zoogloeaceae bacterium]